MTEKQLNDWEKIQEKGKFSYILQQAILFTPAFLLARAVVFYFFGEKSFGIGALFEWLFVSFFTALGCCTVSWYQQRSLYVKTLARQPEIIRD